MNIRERIRVNGEPISEELFTRRFFEVWENLPGRPTPGVDIPRYLQLLTLLSYHVFMTENVDVAIYETHLGGEFDATNIVESPTITAVTSIAMDHVNLLGPTIENITWHKAGIFKQGCLAFSTTQLPAVTRVLQQRAAERQVVLEFVGIDPGLPTDAAALNPIVQRQNCSLAVAVTRAWLGVVPEAQSMLSADDMANGVDKFYWPGRFEKIVKGQMQWFLDGAHNELSVQYAVRWYADSALENQRCGSVESTPPPGAPIRILIFSHYTARDGIAILRRIAETFQDCAIQVQHVIITTDDERRDGRARIGKNNLCK